MRLISAAWHKNCCWDQEKWQKSTSMSICACKFVHFSVTLSSLHRGVGITVIPLPSHSVCRFQPHSITARKSAALGGNNKKTRGHSPRLVYSAGPSSLGLWRKDQRLTNWGEKPLEDKCMLMRESFFGLGGDESAVRLGAAAPTK